MPQVRDAEGALGPYAVTWIVNVIVIGCGSPTALRVNMLPASCPCCVGAVIVRVRTVEPGESVPTETVPLVVGTEVVEPPFTCSVHPTKVNLMKSPPEMRVALPKDALPELNMVTEQEKVDPAPTRVPAQVGWDIVTCPGEPELEVEELAEVDVDVDVDKLEVEVDVDVTEEVKDVLVCPPDGLKPEAKK